MASEILGLFTSPEQYQQQQDLMMQRQAAELAQLDPYQSIRFGAIRAGQQFGRGLAGILGAEDPQLRMISTRQSALQGIDLNSPDSIFNAARQLADAGDQQGALMLADYGRKAQADAALVTQRERERKSPALQAADRVRELITNKQNRLSAGAKPDSDEIKIIDAEIASLSRGGGTGQVPDTIEIANARADAKGLAPGSAERNKFLDEEIVKWAKVISHFLKPGGKFIMADFHPVVWMYDNDFKEVFYSYFNIEPIIEDESGTYADRYSKIEAKTITWNHPISETLNALITNGIVLNSFNEYDYSPYNCFNNTEEFEPNKFRIKTFENKIPMVYYIKGTKK